MKLNKKNLRNLNQNELVEIGGGIEPFTIGLIIGGIIAIWRWRTKDK